MKAKKPIATNKKRSPLFWLLLIVVPLALLLGVNAIYNFAQDKEAQREDDIKSARIETFVNNVKKQLDNKIPEGKWEITNYCTEARIKGDLLGYTCLYYVVSNEKINDKAMLNEIFKNNVHSTTTSFYNELGKYTVYPGQIEGNVECALLISDKNTDSSVGCNTNPNTPTYELVN